MGHTPYGYRIENGKAIIDELAAMKIKALFQSYLSGDSLATAANKAGIGAFHAAVGKMLRNHHYLGDDYYPAIINQDMFDTAKMERLKRAEKLGRVYGPKEKYEVIYPTTFRIKEGADQFEDPFQRAEYAYSLIESEV